MKCVGGVSRKPWKTIIQGQGREEGLVLNIPPRAFWSFMWTCRKGSCASSVVYFCFIVRQTGVKTTTRFWSRFWPMNPVCLFFWSFLCGRVLAGFMAFFHDPSLSRGAGAAQLPSTCSSAPDWVFNAHTCSAAVHQLIRPQRKEMNFPSALCFSGVSDSVSQTWAWILWEFFSCFCHPVSHFNLRPRSSSVFTLSCLLTGMICSPNPISFCINVRFEAL